MLCFLYTVSITSVQNITVVRSNKSIRFLHWFLLFYCQICHSYFYHDKTISTHFKAFWQYLYIYTYANFHFLHALQWQSACSCKISTRSVKRCRRYRGFLLPIWRPSTILNFWKMQIFTFCTVYNGNLRVPAKYGLDRSNACEVISNFRF